MTTIEDVLNVQMYRASVPHELFSYVDGFLLIRVIDTPTPRLRGPASVRLVDSCSEQGKSSERLCFLVDFFFFFSCVGSSFLCEGFR